MPLTLHYGRRRLELERGDPTVLPAPAALPDPAEAVRAALDEPFNFPALRRALTPEDQVAVLLDDCLAELPRLLPPVLEHITAAGVVPPAITLLFPPQAGPRDWLARLPERFRTVRGEVHDPIDRSRLAYLATTAAGKRVYLNRTLVEAAQSVVLTGRRYDLTLGYGGAEGALYPTLSDEETRKEFAGRVRFGPPGEEPWPSAREAREVAWLLGQPFYVQVLAGVGDGVADVVAGAGEACREGQRRLDRLWRHVVPQRFDLVLATLTGDPTHHTFADLAAALAVATRVVRPEGRVVLLTEAAPALGAGIEILRREDDPRDALKELQRHPSQEWSPAIQWTQAACHARLAVRSGLPDDVVEELYATPLQDDAELGRLMAGAACLVIEDAHRQLVTVG